MIAKKSNRISQISINLLFICICISCIVPLITVITISISSNKYLVEHGYSIFPHVIDWDAYKYIFMYPAGLIRAYANSFFVAGVGCFLGLLISSMFAYAISRREFIFRSTFTKYIIFTMLFNGGIVTNYIVVTQYLKLQDNIWAMILPYLVVPLYVLILRTFFAAVPAAIIESAKMDGANELYTFFKIVIPISKPALASVAFLILLTYWNDWWLGLLYINNPKIATLQVTLNQMLTNIDFLRSTSLGGAISQSDFPSESARMAMCVLIAGPMVVILPFFQKYFVKGMTMGSVK
jgi:putative aldouronate transport system permease protein